MTSILKEIGKAPLSAQFGMLVILIYAIVAIFAPVIAPYGEREVVGAQFLPWDATHVLGTDNLGRDTLSRIIYGARNTVGIALAATILTFLLGGLSAGGSAKRFRASWTPSWRSRR